MSLSYKEKAYSFIKNKILYCELAPGDILDQNALAEEIGVSRTPVREAINLLEQDDLVNIIPRKGVVVSNLSVNDINSIYVVREMVEPEIARLVTPHVEIEVLKKYKDIFSKDREIDAPEIMRNDSLLHKYLINMTGNKYLIKLMEGVLAQNQRVVILAAEIPERLNTSNSEHIEIIDFMLNRDEAGAEEAMRKHIQRARQSAFNASKRGW